MPRIKTGWTGSYCIGSSGVKIPAALSGVHRFVLTKSFASLKLTWWSLEKLLENTSLFGFCTTNPLSMMTPSVEHFHSTAQVKYVLMSHFQYIIEFIRKAKEALRKSHTWSAHYFTNRKGIWHPPTNSCIYYNELSLVLPNKNCICLYCCIRWVVVTWRTFKPSSKNKKIHSKKVLRFFSKKFFLIFQEMDFLVPR